MVEMMHNKVMFDSCLTIFCWKDSFIIPSGAGFRFKPELFEHFLGGLRSAEILQAQQKIRSSTVKLGSHHRSISEKKQSCFAVNGNEKLMNKSMKP